MPDDVLRMRATVSSEEALASVRQIGRAFGLLPAQVKPPLDQVNLSLTRFSQSIQNVSKELRTAIPALGGFGLGAAGAGAAAYGLIRTLTNISDRMVELKYRSRELGMSERELRAWGAAAQQVGIAPEAMQASLEGFKKTTDDFKYRMGAAREELIRMGAGPVVQRITNAATQLDKLKEAFDFKEVLDKMDPSGERGRRFFQDIQLGSAAARLSYEQYVQTLERTKPRTAEQEAEAQKAKNALIALGEAYDNLSVKAAVVLFPGLTNDVETLAKVLEYLGDIKGWRDAWDKLPKELFDFSFTPPSGGDAPQAYNPETGRPQIPQMTMPPRRGFKQMSFTDGDGFGAQGGDLSEGSRMVKEGTFAALVEFQAYVGAGGAAAGGAGTGGFTGGFQRTSFSPGGGAGFGTGGGGGAGGGAPGYGGAMGFGGASTGGGGGGGAGGPDAQPGAAAPGGPGGIPGSGSVPPEVMSEAKNLLMRGASTGQLQSFMQSKGYPKQGAWCGEFAASVVKEAGGTPPKGAATASNWLSWGQHVDPRDVQEGDVAVRTRSRFGGAVVPGRTGGHVALVGAVGDKTFQRVGGNQGRPVVDTSRYSGEYEFRRGKAEESAGPTGGGGSAEDRKIVKGSVFGSTHGWSDPSEPRGRKTASGVSNEIPGIALPSRAGLGKMYEVTTPDGRTFQLPQTDIGPGKQTGRGIDITSSAAAQMGYDKKTFPTDGRFSYRRLDDSVGGANVKAEGTVNVNVTAPPGTKSSATSAGMFQKTNIKNNKQMQPTDSPHVEAGPG